MSKYQTILVNPTEIDETGFRARISGKEVRDCICIQQVGGPTLSLLVRDAMETTVHECVVRKGLGVLDIDGSRITTSANDFENMSKIIAKTPRTSEDIYDSGLKRNGTPPNKEGRFPSNLILKHGEKCKCMGTKKVKGSQLDHDCGKFGQREIYGSGTRKMNFKGYTDKDGKEEVADWECEPSCPVILLDQQSGILKSGYLSPDHDVKATTGWSGGSQANRVKNTFESNEGGASRFFKQVQTEEELAEYLTILIRSK